MKVKSKGEMESILLSIVKSWKKKNGNICQKTLSMRLDKLEEDTIS